MLFFNKLLPAFVLPVGVIAALVLLAAWRRWRWLSVVAALALVAGSMQVVANLLLGPLEDAYPARSVASVPEADAALVLGGVMSPVKETGLTPEWGEAVERFEGGLALAQRGKVRLLLFTGDTRGSEGTALRREAVLRGLPESRVAVIGAVGNTADEAAQLRAFARERGLKRVVLVTSAWHLPRAMRQFRGAGVELVPFPVDYRAQPNRLLPYLDWIPTAGALAKTELALRESYGILFYSVFGGGGGGSGKR